MRQRSEKHLTCSDIRNVHSYISFIAYVIAIILFVHPTPAKAQMWDSLATTDYRVDSSMTRTLRVVVDNLSFFRDNEYSSTLTKGYSLPGLWIQPRLAYTPHRQIDLELGLHAAIFQGANKYPNYVYHDISVWKGSQYQRGAHVLPWIRARAQFQNLTVVMGDIYGGQNHQLMEPLFHPETNLSQDPEAGFQLLWDRKHLHADTWLNWQSFIFEEDSHQGAFTVGASWKIYPGDTSKPLRWYVPVQLVIQHRGGEQDTTAMGVQTIANAATGAGITWTPHSARTLTRLFAEADALFACQQSGHLWPFDNGAAFHATAGVSLWQRLHIRGGYFIAPKHFVSL
ncbi:MAG: hypothetical protein SO411_03955, partial [Bacteroidaceae bacterium]|nr:hypothetical protein [Bacteroidaceae bacterium]